MSLISIDYKRYWHCRSGVVGWVASCPLIGKRTGKASVRASCVADVQRMHRQCRIGYMRRGSAWNMPSAFAVAKVSTYATSRSALQHRHLVAAQGQDIDAISTDRDRMLELGGELPVVGHDRPSVARGRDLAGDRKSTRLNSSH